MQQRLRHSQNFFAIKNDYQITLQISKISSIKCSLYDTKKLRQFCTVKVILWIFKLGKCFTAKVANKAITLA